MVLSICFIVGIEVTFPMPSLSSPNLNMRAVAQKAGVSAATVSRVINGYSWVKKETAERVQKVLDELNFTPNPIATALKYGRSTTYGLIVPDLTNPFFPEFLLRFEELLIENNYEILVATTQGNSEKLNLSVRRMLMRSVDGVVLMPSEFETRSIEMLLNHRIPFVTLDRRLAQKNNADVSIDYEHGFQQAILYLKDLGHRKIGFISGVSGMRSSKLREDAFKKAIEHAGLRYDPLMMQYGDFIATGGHTAMSSLLKLGNRPTAVLTANDLMAFGALQALHESNLRVPDEFSIIGCDGISLGAATAPPLTTIAVSQAELAQACLSALQHAKDHAGARGAARRVACTLLVRGSTAAPPKAVKRVTKTKSPSTPQKKVTTARPTRK